jgi:hypothetical protein
MESLANTELEPLTGIIERMREGDPDAARMIYDRFAAELRAVLSALISRLAKTSYFQFRRIAPSPASYFQLLVFGNVDGSRICNLNEADKTGSMIHRSCENS